jgi:hypothetical protein
VEKKAVLKKDGNFSYMDRLDGDFWEDIVVS